MKTDSELRREVERELEWEPSVDERRIGVSVMDGIVTLTGEVSSFGEKWRAERAVERVAGVRGIANDLEVKLLSERKITVTLDAKAKSWLASAGYDPVYGARPLKRVIQRNLQDPLANLILEGDVSDGDTVVVSAGKHGLVINGHEVENNGDGLGLIGGLEPPPPRHAVH